jgi:hypothetical protein
VLFSTQEFDNAFTHADKMWIIHDRELIAGAPEDLGIRKLFEKLFAESSVTFDHENLRFMRKNPSSKQIQVDFLNEEVNYWTCRALERIGYKMVTDQKPDTGKVFIRTSHEGYIWTFQDDRSKQTFGSLYDMANYLIGLK